MLLASLSSVAKNCAVVHLCRGALGERSQGVIFVRHRGDEVGG